MPPFLFCRCGQETRVIPRILQLRSHWLKSEKESLRLVEAGITKEVMNSAIAQFCLEIIAKHGDPAPRLCNKDPLTLKMGTYVIELFPNVRNPSKQPNQYHPSGQNHLPLIPTFQLLFRFLFRRNFCLWYAMDEPQSTRLFHGK